MMKHVDRTGPTKKESQPKMGAVRPQKIANVLKNYLEEIKESSSPEDREVIQSALDRTNGKRTSNHT